MGIALAQPICRLSRPGLGRRGVSLPGSLRMDPLHGCGGLQPGQRLDLGGQIRIIAFIIYSADIRQILNHIGLDAQALRITPARGPPPWDGCDAQTGEGVELEPDGDEVAQLAPDFETDQRVSW